MSSTLLKGARFLFGIFLFVFGLNKFLGFLPLFEIPGDGGTLMAIYSSSGFMYLIGALEMLCGLALLLNKFVPLALTIAVAIMFNAVVFHLLHDPINVAGAAAGLLLGLSQVWNYKERFESLLRA